MQSPFLYSSSTERSTESSRCMGPNNGKKRQNLTLPFNYTSKYIPFQYEVYANQASRIDTGKAGILPRLFIYIRLFS